MLGEHIDGGGQNGTTQMSISPPLKPVDGYLHGPRAFASRGREVCRDPVVEKAEAEEGKLKAVAA